MCCVELFQRCSVRTARFGRFPKCVHYNCKRCTLWYTSGSQSEFQGLSLWVPRGSKLTLTVYKCNQMDPGSASTRPVAKSALTSRIYTTCSKGVVLQLRVLGGSRNVYIIILIAVNNTFAEISLASTITISTHLKRSVHSTRGNEEEVQIIPNGVHCGTQVVLKVGSTRV